MRKSFKQVFALILLSCLITLSPLSFAQNKILTVEDAVTRGHGRLSPQKLSQLNWIPGTNVYYFVSRKDEKEILFREDALKKTKAEAVVSIEELNRQLNALKSPNDNMPRFPIVEWENDHFFRFRNGDSVYSFNTAENKLALRNSLSSKNPELAQNEEFSPEKGYAAFTKDNNLFISMGSVSPIQVTFDTDPAIVNGQAVHRNEFGITKGIFWSPKGSYVAFYRMDQTMVTDYPLVDIKEHPAKLTNIKYPMAGMKSHEVTIGIYNIASGKTIFLETGEPKDQYLTNVTWSPDEKNIYVAHLNRDQNFMQMVKYDALTGKKLKTLFEEKDSKYVEPLNGPIFIKNSNRFLWLSRRDGWNHLYLYDTEGSLIKQLTKGEWEITDFNGFDLENKNALITSTQDGVLERHVYKVNLETGKSKKLTEARGTHEIRLNSSGQYMLDNFSSTNTPSVFEVLDAEGKAVKEILRAPNPLKDYKLGEMRLFSIKAESGEDLYCRMILPADFDSTKKYPVLVYVYGGPHSQLVTDSWLGGANLWLNYMAEKGYIVFTLDNRGTSNRGMKFEQQTFRHLGTVEIEDQLTGIKYLKSLPYTDQNRIGVFGWSFGGFMATSLMTRASDVFKVGVAGGPVIDWSYYEIMYGERYMDTPESNPAGYKESSLLNYVGNLKGKLLLIHGTVDPTVVCQNSLLFVQKAVSLGIPLDYFPYPGHEHGVVGNDSIHLYEKISSYFNDNLKNCSTEISAMK
ncbi:MAG: S9 family peptidase [Ignavibacteria bacterium]|jgi:dipeptidyl-peptidase-4|nr:S9 family peptidase [Ignavibacteria bacterium]MCU7505034.1 S9 family peptidase [Ignavibacteria bacterium]MCU7515326.1 S9 family peptidase [Ignavibacteria bacterium]